MYYHIYTYAYPYFYLGQRPREPLVRLAQKVHQGVGEMRRSGDGSGWVVVVVVVVRVGMGVQHRPLWLWGRRSALLPLPLSVVGVGAAAAGGGGGAFLLLLLGGLLTCGHGGGIWDGRRGVGGGGGMGESEGRRGLEGRGGRGIGGGEVVEEEFLLLCVLVFILVKGGCTWAVSSYEIVY